MLTRFEHYRTVDVKTFAYLYYWQVQGTVVRTGMVKMMEVSREYQCQNKVSLALAAGVPSRSYGLRLPDGVLLHDHYTIMSAFCFDRHAGMCSACSAT